MNEFAKDYYNNLVALVKDIRVTDKEGNKLDFYQAVELVCDIILQQAEQGNKIMFIGNGASAAISSHMATDFWKNGEIRAMAFNDGALLTCVGNDYGYKHIFEKPIEMFADKGDILVAISSSGRSENILRGVSAAQSKQCRIITLSGFKEDNPLRSLGSFNFYVPCSEYGLVEVLHHSVCHCVLDTIIEVKSGQIQNRQPQAYLSSPARK